MIYEGLATNPDFGAYFIIWQNASFAHPTLQYCDQVRRQNGLTMPVLIWQDPQTAVDLGFDERHWHFVMRRGAEIVERRQFNDSTFAPVVEQLLAE